MSKECWNGPDPKNRTRAACEENTGPYRPKKLWRDSACILYISDSGYADSMLSVVQEIVPEYSLELHLGFCQLVPDDLPRLGRCS